MIDTDITRALAIIALVLLLVIYMNGRAERKRDERRYKLQDAARVFADALIEFAEGTAND